MPIVSRSLTKLANRDDIAPGVKRWRVDGVDGRGRSWVYGPFSGTQAEAETVRDAAWTTAQLQDHEEQLALDHVEAGNDPDSFVRQDLTQQQLRRRIVVRWARSQFESGELSRRSICRIATWLAQFTAQQIRDGLGVSLPVAQRILARATDLRDNVCPALSADDSRKEEI